MSTSQPKMGRRSITRTGGSKIVKGATLKVYPGLPHGMCSSFFL
jgi:hypothetical protein